MLEADVVAVSASTTYRVLHQAGLFDPWNRKPSNKGTGYVQHLGPHHHWRMDISYLNLSGTFYCLCSVLDGYSRSIIDWEIRESMKASEVETILQRACKKHPTQTRESSRTTARSSSLANSRNSSALPA